MFATTFLPPVFQRVLHAVGSLFKRFLMLAGMVSIMAFVGWQAGGLGLLDGLKPIVPVAAASVGESPAVAEDDSDDEDEAAEVSLNPRMRAALDYVSRRYRVSTEAVQPVFATAEAIGRELHLDPLLIIAVIGVESGFNPFSQSVVGAQGLMQVVPRFHMDKLPGEADSSAFLDPVTNVQVGARVLKESIRRFGGLEDGLQQFGGAPGDPERRYASRVLAEKQRLESAAQRLRAG